MINPKLKYFFFLLFQFCAVNIFAQSDSLNTEAIRDKQRVNYVYNFTNYIDWEGLEDRGSFVIGVLGENEQNLVQEFKANALKRRIKGLPVVVKSFDKIAEIVDVDILYVNNSYRFDLNPILEKLYVSHSLLVTEGYPFHVSMINFIELDDEFHFEINKEKINRAQLLVAPKLLSFSTQSTADWDQLYNRLKKEMNTVKAQKEELAKLSNQINTQRKELLFQEKKLNETLDSIAIQKKLLQSQKMTILGQNSNINQQIRQLNLLKSNISEQKEANDYLKIISNSQAKGISEQSLEIRQQKETLKNQLSDISQQAQKIENQKNNLGLQLTQIQQQRVLLAVFVAFALSAIVFSVFILQANRRRKQSEAAILLKNEELEYVNKALDSFTYRVSHDLKAPVVNMKNLIGLLKKFVDPASNDLLPELFKNLDASANRLDLTIIGMLELTKIDRIKENKVPCNVLDIVQSILPEYEKELAEIGGKVNLSKMTDNIAIGTPAEFTSIFQNLITNSIKYRSKNRTLEIAIRTKIAEAHCHITYSDNGMGIDLEKYEGKLFGIFERFTGDSSISGTGIGMHSIKKMIENNKGTINLKSAPDKGLTYVFTLPAS